MAGSGDVDALLVGAETLVAEVPSAFEHGRTQLCWGERLRRDGRRVDARRHLGTALEHFRLLGAEPWSERARRELRAAGARPSRKERGLTTAVMPTESQIATLAAEVRTNKEVAASRFLSPKTIEVHLGHIYRKLEIHNRTQLARSIAAGSGSSRP